MFQIRIVGFEVDGQLITNINPRLTEVATRRLYNAQLLFLHFVVTEIKPKQFKKELKSVGRN